MVDAVGITTCSPAVTPDRIWVTLSPSIPVRTATAVCWPLRTTVRVVALPEPVIAVDGTVSASLARPVTTEIDTDWPERSFFGGLTRRKVTPYSTTLLDTVEVESIDEIFAVAVTPGSASKVTVAVWPTFRLAASASAKNARASRWSRSSMVTKPLDELLESDVVEPLVVELVAPVVDDEAVELVVALPPDDEPPTVPFSATTVPEIGARRIVPASVSTAL